VVLAEHLQLQAHLYSMQVVVEVVALWAVLAEREDPAAEAKAMALQALQIVVAVVAEVTGHRRGRLQVQVPAAMVVQEPVLLDSKKRPAQSRLFYFVIRIFNSGR
jgi:hypothetical protein